MLKVGARSTPRRIAAQRRPSRQSRRASRLCEMAIGLLVCHLMALSHEAGLLSERLKRRFRSTIASVPYVGGARRGKCALGRHHVDLAAHAVVVGL